MDLSGGLPAPGVPIFWTGGGGGGNVVMVVDEEERMYELRAAATSFNNAMPHEGLARLLRDHDAEVAATALREAADEMQKTGWYIIGKYANDWLRDRADTLTPTSEDPPMTAVMPLACWPFPLPPVIVAALKVAKEELCQRDGIEFMIQLCEAVPASPTRVLSFNGPTPFACDSAKLREWNNPDELRYWLEWVLDEEKPLSLGFSMADWLSRTWPGTKQVATSQRYIEPGEGFWDDKERWVDLPY